MNTSPRKIWLILFSIILIPVLIFAVLQLTTLNENEKIIKDIYSKQLDAILYSVNQYSEDVVSSWKNKIKAFPEETGSTENYFKKFLNENPTIKFLFLTDSLRNIKFKTTDSVSNEQINLFLSSNNDKINNLYKFKESGYERVEPVNGKIFSNSTSLIFLNDEDICVLTIDPYLFIRNILEPKLQEVSREEFNLSVYDSTNSNSVYSTNKSNQEIDQEVSPWFQEVEQYRSLWLLSGFSLGISLRGASIQELAEDRVYTNIILVLGLAILLIAGNWFVYRNTKKEIELARIKSDFVSNVSHELRTPLSLINMFAETLELDRVKSDEKKKEYYSIISNEANRLSRIVNKILNFSRMEAGKKTYNFTIVKINEIVESTFNTYKFHLQNNGFTFKLIQSDNLPEISADNEAVSEALINLIDNAVKYSNEQKEIIITTGFDTEKVFIEVQDKGIGISQDDQKRIFEKFFRATTGSVHNTKGTGLGLTIVKHIMEAHKGEIKLKSNIEKGSTFRLEFKINTKQEMGHV